MSKKPLIAISTITCESEKQHYIWSQYIQAVLCAGGRPYLIPTLGQVEDYPFDGLILSGGGDIHPECYRGELVSSLYKMSKRRDETELYLARYAIEHNIPVLGICRGMQILNVALGGDLYPHIPDAVSDAIQHRTGAGDPIAHHITIEPNSRLAGVLGVIECSVSSQHHQSLRRLADSLKVTATAKDGVVEAIEHLHHRWLIGVQWHPEQTAGQDSIQQRLFDIFVQECSKGE